MVIGAGLAGLTTARRLTQRGVDVVVLEAKDRVGGRTVNLPIGDGQITEGGGQWVGPSQDRVLALADELGVARFKTYITGRNVMVAKGRRKTYRGGTPPLAVAALEDFAQAQQRFDKLARSVPLGRPWAATQADDWDAMTVESWASRNLQTDGARRLFLAGFATTTAVPGRAISLLDALHFVHACGGLESMGATAGGAQDSRFVGGSQRLSLEMARALGQGRVFRHAPVERIVPRRKGGVVVHSALGPVSADRVVISARPDDCRRISFPRTTERRLLEHSWQTGFAFKAFAVYERPFWREAGLSGMAITDLPALPVTYDNSPPDGSRGVLFSFMLSHRETAGLGLSSSALNSRGARRALLLDCLAHCFGPQARRPISYLEQDWTREPYIGGCESPRPPGLITRFPGADRDPHGKIHFAGTDTAHRWPGYMDGAVRSGERAAEEVRAEL